jgi:ubiquitin-like modifier-activating enzyme ATG7
MHKGKYMPRRVDLSATMDPIRLAEQSVDLNLKLMRWRLLPALDIAALARTKCLLLGAGTLGCSVARGLLGWGVRTITLVDNGRVALSNPVRQSLFEYTDCADGGKPKALAAATALRRIFPGVVAEGHVMTIPMPGHPVSSPAEEASARREVELLDKLVAEHDVIFLLTDTRESRWLPTVLGAMHDKILVNAALGFDTFMVMRHGAQPTPPLTSVAPSCSGGEDGGTARESKARTGKGSPGPADGDGIGCYFCNDVVAPDDSTKDRTLDQQCTVTRPGLAPVASALAVELMVALLHHPLRHRAPADGGEASGLGHRFLDDPDRPLGILPQQIRGYLAHFTTILPVTRAFQHCTGCAPAVIEAYKREGAGLVLRVCNEQGVLEEMTGLAQMRRETDALELSWSEDEDEEEEEELEGGGKEKEVEMGEKEQKGREKPTQEWNVKEEEKKSDGVDLALEDLAIEHAGIRRTGGNCE